MVTGEADRSGTVTSLAVTESISKPCPSASRVCCSMASTVGGVEPKNRCDLTAYTGQPPTDVGEQVPETPGGIGVGEEARRVAILVAGRAFDDLSQIGCEIGLGDRASENVRGAAYRFRISSGGSLSSLYLISTNGYPASRRPRTERSIPKRRVMRFFPEPFDLERRMSWRDLVA